MVTLTRLDGRADWDDGPVESFEKRHRYEKTLMPAGSVAAARAIRRSSARRASRPDTKLRCSRRTRHWI